MPAPFLLAMADLLSQHERIIGSLKVAPAQFLSALIQYQLSTSNQ